MISNLQLLQHAHQHINDPTIDPSFKNDLLPILSQQRNLDDDFSTPSRKTERVDHFATVLFPQNKLTFFDRLKIRNLMLSTFSSAAGKSGDDSSIVFRLKKHLYMGRIRSIFTVMETRMTFLLIEYPTSFNTFSCQIGKDTYFKYSYIQTCSKKNFSTRLIECFEIVEKCVFYESPNGDRHFMRFPTLQHSS